VDVVVAVGALEALVVEVEGDVAEAPAMAMAEARCDEAETVDSLARLPTLAHETCRTNGSTTNSMPLLEDSVLDVNCRLVLICRLPTSILASRNLTSKNCSLNSGN